MTEHDVTTCPVCIEALEAQKPKKPTRVLQLRPSACDRAWYCAESLNPTVAVDPVGDAAELGSAFHEVMRARINQVDHSVDEIAERYGIALEDLQKLIAYAGVAERDLSNWFPGDVAEQRLSMSEPFDAGDYTHIALAGTVDRFSMPHPQRAAVLDWKTGMVEGYVHQQRAYAFLALRENPDIAEVYSATVYVRLGHWTGRLYSASDLESWWADMKRRLVNGLGSFSPGSHCGYCPRRSECPGVHQYAQACLSTLADNPAERALQLTENNATELGPALADTLRQVRYIEARCGEFRNALRDRVREAGGEVPAGDDKVLKIVAQRRRTLDARLAWPVLQARLTDNQIADACKISVSKCQDAAAANAVSGKGAARKQLEDELIEAEALKIEITEQLREVGA